MSFNLNNAVDFARVTNSLASSIGLQAADILERLSGKREWQIFEASYNGKKFHIFKSANQDGETFQAALSSAVDSGGRRKAIFKFPYVDGQTTEDLGREGTTYSFDCIFFGPNYQAGWDAFRAELNKPTPGILVHPIYGEAEKEPEGQAASEGVKSPPSLTVVPRSWSYTHQSDTRQAVMVRVEFIEHNFTLAALNKQTDRRGAFKDLLSKALRFFASVETVINRVGATVGLATSLRNQLTNGLNDVTASYRLALARTNASFNAGGPSGSSDIPGVVPAQQGGFVASDGTLDTSGSQFAPSINDPYVGATPQASDGDIVALTPQQAVDQANAYREQVNELIALYESSGQVLSFTQDILFLKQSAVDLQDLVEAGIRTSRPRIIEYTLPRDMTLREVCFANGLPVDRAIDIDRLNPTLDSVNNVVKGSVIQVPTI